MASRSIHNKRQSGQSIILAVAVLFILAFLAALFVALLARNLQSTNRASQTLTADYFAQAGIEYADQMLTTSAQGADWRPPLQYELGATYSGSLTADEAAAYTAYTNPPPPAVAPLGQVPTDDPDAFWLGQGFSRYNMPGGRYLLRISYGDEGTGDGSIFDNVAPQNGSVSLAAAKYLRIESIGRVGNVINNDPTTFTPQPIRLHAEEVAYKPIGLVDYSRFITNKYNRPDTANLGVPSTYDPTVDGNVASIVTPGVYDFASVGTQFNLWQYPLVTIYGNPYAPSGSPNVGFGGSVRCNTNLNLYGFNAAFLDGSMGDDWEVAGNLTFDGFNATNGTPASTNPTVLTVTGTDTTGGLQQGALATPSNITSTAFGGQYSTIDGLIRDAGTTSDVNGFPRDIQRLNPPDLDTIDPSSPGADLTRYQEIAQTGTAATSQYPGPYSMETATSPATVYIDNASDVQPESANVQAGGYTLRNDWLSHDSYNWEGPFYNPPGATIVFGPLLINNGNGYSPYWGFTVTRTDQPVGLPSGSPVTWQWKDPNGQTDVQSTPAPTIQFAYGTAPAGFQFDANNPVYFLSADNIGTNGQVSGGKDNNDVVIYAEGNVRVRGVISPTSATDPVTQEDYEIGGGFPPPHHVTIVTGQIAYIEGSLLKGGPNYEPPTTTPTYEPGYLSNSSVAVLAESYVCLNTTQFLAGASLKSDLASETSDQAAGTIDFDTNTLTEAFDLPANDYTAQPNLNVEPPELYLSQSAGGDIGSSYGEISFNQATYSAAPPVPGPVVYDGATMDTAPNGTSYLTGASGAYNRTVLPLYTNLTGPVTFGAPANGFSHMEFTITKSPESAATYALQRAAVLPSDVRIEAVLYAQDNSFFVIPGPWFNDDATDTIDKYLNNNARSRPDQYAINQPGFTDEQFPFYGQPIDMQISIDGSVIENLPADTSDQTAWMDKWGWIPKYQGAELGETADTTPIVNSAHMSLWSELGGTTGTTVAPLDPPTAPALGIPQTIQATLPAVGLNIAYDPTAGSGASQGVFDRLDEYGRPLPYVPELPVSPDLLYSGTTPGNSLVQ